MSNTKADKKLETKRTETQRRAKEVCTCGHSRVAHAGTEFHGRCFVGKNKNDFCTCAKFTWSGVKA